MDDGKTKRVLTHLPAPSTYLTTLPEGACNDANSSLPVLRAGDHRGRLHDPGHPESHACAGRLGEHRRRSNRRCGIHSNRCGGFPKDAFNWWLGDPPHKAVILDDRVKEFGVGYAYLPQTACGSYYVVDLGVQ